MHFVWIHTQARRTATATKDANTKAISLLPAVQYAPVGWTGCPSTCCCHWCPTSNVAVIASPTEFGHHCLTSGSCPVAVQDKALTCLWPRYRLDSSAKLACPSPLHCAVCSAQPHLNAAYRGQNVPISGKCWFVVLASSKVSCSCTYYCFFLCANMYFRCYHCFYFLGDMDITLSTSWVISILPKCMRITKLLQYLDTPT